MRFLVCPQCDYEIFVSLKIRDEERAEDRRGERYTLDFYTAHKHRREGYGTLQVVGLVDGVAAADEEKGYSASVRKAHRDPVVEHQFAAESVANRGPECDQRRKAASSS